MTIQELKKQILQLSSNERWQLVKTLLGSLQQEANPPSKHRNLLSLRGIAKIETKSKKANNQDDYITYLTEKYR